MPDWSKRTFLKSAAAAAATLPLVTGAEAKPRADLPKRWNRAADVVVLGAPAPARRSPLKTPGRTS